MLRPVPAALAVAIALVLTSCAAPASPVPAPSPTSRVTWPVVPGRVLETSSDGRTTTERIAVSDPETAYAQARDRLVAAGFQLTKDRPGTGGGDGQACTTRLCVDFAATTERPWGSSVLYSAFHSTGVAPLG